MTTQLSPMRSGRITASRVAPILGIGKYGSAEEVMRELVRDYFGDPAEFEGNDATRWGNDHEEDARTVYEQGNGVMVLDAQEFIVHPEFEWIGVSPDGLVGADGVFEAKCPYRARYTTVAEVPHYYAQIQLQLACTGRAWADFVIWRSFDQADRLGVEPLIVERVPADRDWLNTHIVELADFHARYLEIIADPMKAAPYRADVEDPERSDEGWAQASARFLELDAQIKDLTVLRDEARDALVALAGDRSAKGLGVQVIRTVRAGSVDYRAITEKYARDVDVEEFRKAATSVVTVKELKA